jgi:hypothetical protein
MRNVLLFLLTGSKICGHVDCSTNEYSFANVVEAIRINKITGVNGPVRNYYPIH